MTATTEFVVPRSMPMILPMVRVSWCGLVVGLVGRLMVRGRRDRVSSIGLVGSVGRRSAAGAVGAGRPRRRRPSPGAGPGRGSGSRAGARSRSLPSGWPDPGTDTIASCSRGSNGAPGATSIGVTPSLSRSSRSFRSIAATPSAHGSSASAVRPGLDRPVEVVGQRHDLAQQTVGGQTGVALALVGGPAPEVLELGALALEPGEVLGRLGVGRLELALELVDLLEELGRRDVDLVDAFLGSGAVGHGWVSLAWASVVRRRGGRRARSSGRTRTRRCRSRGDRPSGSGPRTPTTPTARPGRPYGARTSDTSRISAGAFSWPMNTWIRPLPAMSPTSSPRYVRFSSAEKTRRSFSLWANSGASMTLSRPSL